MNVSGARGRPSSAGRAAWPVAVATAFVATSLAAVAADALPGTTALDVSAPLDEAMVAGIDRFLLRATAERKAARRAAWATALADEAGRETFRTSARARLREILGVVDPRVPGRGIVVHGAIGAPLPLATEPGWTAVAVSYEALEGVAAEGIALLPAGREPRAWVVAIGDAQWPPEEFAGLLGADGAAGAASRLPRALVAAGCAVFLPALLDRDDEFSGNAAVRFTNQSHREYVYRQAFALGRHPLGYEIQKVLAAVDRIEAAGPSPVGVCGVGEGGRLALLAAACDERIDAALVCGSFGTREDTWREPIDRNVWRLLGTASDAEAAALVLPRPLVVEAAIVPAYAGPRPQREGRRGGAAPGRIEPVAAAAFADEWGAAAAQAAALGAAARIERHGDPAAPAPAGGDVATAALLRGLGVEPPRRPPAAATRLLDGGLAAVAHRERQRRQVEQLSRFTQLLRERAAAVRARAWADVAVAADRRDAAAAEAALAGHRDAVRREMIGMIDEQPAPAAVRSRRILDDPAFTGWEVTVDVFTDVFAGGILLVPKGIPAGERRPAVVCQHGLEDVPLGVIAAEGEAFAVSKGFAAELARRGFVTFAPQNPYRGHDRFRTLQRKANPLGWSLFSFIVPQHGRILDFLAVLPEVDAARIGFYGISYGGKTALRVPPFEPRYRAVICSADFNDWVRKVADDQSRFSYVFTGEYEIFEWNMGHVASHAELAWLVWPRPFMVERGHDDGVAPDEWVAGEFARARRHWVKLGTARDIDIEWFDGPHAIHGEGTFDFLDRHLRGDLPAAGR